MQQPQQFQVAAAQQVQQPTQQMQADFLTPPEGRMQSAMQQTQQLQTSAAQQPTQQMQGVLPITTKERMQSMMYQTQNLQTAVAQRVQQPTTQQPTTQMQGIYSTPTKEHMQSVSSLSPASPKKRSFQFMENIVPTDFVANPNNHARWSISPNGDRTYLNGPQAKKARTSRK